MSWTEGHLQVPNLREAGAPSKYEPIQNNLIPSILCRVSLLLLLTLSVLTIMGGVSAQAQVLYGTLWGNVTDQTGSVVTGASVEASDTATGVTKFTKTNDAGQYQFTYLVAGPYTISVTISSFKKVVSEPISVETNITKRFDVQLYPATVGQTVIVTSSAPTLQTDRADLSYELSSSQLEDLPVSLSSGTSAGMRLA